MSDDVSFAEFATEVFSLRALFVSLEAESPRRLSSLEQGNSHTLTLILSPTYCCNNVVETEQE